MVVLSKISLKSWSLFIQMSFFKISIYLLIKLDLFPGESAFWITLIMSLLYCGSILLAQPISFKLIITVHIEACSDTDLWKKYLRCGGVLPIALYQEPLHFWLSFLLCPWDWSLGGGGVVNLIHPYDISHLPFNSCFLSLLKFMA